MFFSVRINAQKSKWEQFQKEYEMLSKEKKEDLKKTADALKEIYKTIDQYEVNILGLEIIPRLS